MPRINFPDPPSRVPPRQTTPTQATPVAAQSLTHVATNVPERGTINLSCEVGVTCEVMQLEPLCQIKDVERTLNESKDKPVLTYPGWVRPEMAQRVRGLNCFETIREMLLAGIPTLEVARKVHELGELTALKLDSVRVYIEHYKATIPPWLMLARNNSQKYKTLCKQTDEAINVRQEYIKLYRQVEERIDQGMQLSKKFGVLTKDLEKSFLVAIELVGRIDNVTKDLGLHPSQEKLALPPSVLSPTETDWNKAYTRESVAKVMQNTDSRTRVLRVAERMLDMYGSKLTPEQVEHLKKVKADYAPQEEPEKT